MMINPITVMKMLNERHQFIQNHPEFYPFLKENFGNGIEPGTVIEVRVKRPGEDGERKVMMEVQESERAFFKAAQEILG